LAAIVALTVAVVVDSIAAHLASDAGSAAKRHANLPRIAARKTDRTVGRAPQLG
jgi:hypothetical protein